MAKILVISANLPDWSKNSGGKERTLTLVEALSEHEVTFLSFNWDNELINKKINKNLHHYQPQIGHTLYKRRQRLVNDFAKLNHDTVFEILKDDLEIFTSTAKELSKSCDLIIVDHYSVSPLLQNIKNVPIIYNSHNAEFELGKQVHGESKELMDLVEKMETRILKQAQEITYCSSADFVKIKNHYGQSIRGKYIPNGTIVQDKINYENRLRSRDIIFVGSGHPPNKAAAKKVVAFAQSMPEFNFIIIGGCGSGIKSPNIPSNVQIVGHVNDELLDKYFRTSFAFVNPMLNGSGTHLKMMKALGYAIPIITSTVGARGFSDQEIEEAMLIADTEDDFYQKIKTLKDKEVYKNLCENAYKHSKTYDWDKIKKDYANFIDECINKYAENKTKEANLKKEKEKILICSIVRNDEHFYLDYYKKIKAMVDFFPEYEFYLSLYENDSVDATSSLMLKQDYSMFNGVSIISEKINTRFYGSSKDEDRVKNLSLARNKALTANNFLNSVNYVLMIDVDVDFKMSDVEKILNFKDLEPNFNIVAAATKRRRVLYDQWATREGPRYDPAIQELFEQYKKEKYTKYYSVSSGFCLYQAQPFKDGARYGYINKETGEPDCEMVVICQEFQERGYKNIYMANQAEMTHNHN
jgi:glycosyltransferase involved in cell wall biosynthesis